MKVKTQIAKNVARNILRKLRMLNENPDEYEQQPKIRIFAPVTDKRSINTAYLLTGGNMGSREVQLAKAKQLLEQAAGPVIHHSSLYETSAWGNIPQPAFLNQVLCLHTHLDAESLLQTALLIEQKMGRERMVKFGPRVIDIDILFFNNNIIDRPELTIPHPYLHVRRFTLIPLVEIAPNLLHPVFNKTMHQLLTECPDTLDVKKFSAEND